MKEIYYISDLEELKALSDPLRVDILMKLGKTPQNSQEIANSLGIPRSRIHYHLKIMEDMGFIEVVDTDMVNGIVQKYYLPTALAFVPDPSIFSNFLNGESEVFSISMDDEKQFMSEFKELVKRYSVDNGGKDSIRFNLWKID
ncbi:ArsR/SmtB family transcription factor [Microaceticoccus formicicus]|uniref:ArsR/SmtB family transcription factor n=1 Tax=Microaceticoccus formicicus TaxID=3118105 RepID=UPI003CD035A1|nr:winged helix-turn-helix domain-containing protein [Peptoniphilaceae bacterium AMB_02]